MYKIKTSMLLGALAAALFAAGMPEADACTNIIVTKGASMDASTLVSYAADSHTTYGCLFYRAPARWKIGDMEKVYDYETEKYLADIPQPEETFGVVSNMNDHQVIITETTFGGREELVDRRGKLDYGALMRLTLQRATTAREAIDIIVELATKYGYCSEGETLSIADKEEAWIFELVGKGMAIRNGVNSRKGIVWVAVRIPDGAVCAHANQSRITRFPLDDPDNCLYAKDVISFARRMGYFDGEDAEFSFRDAYNPVDFGGARACEARVWSVFNTFSDGWFTLVDSEGKATTVDAYSYLDFVLGYKPEAELPLYIFPRRKISLKNVADMMRDHFEGTPMDMTQDIGAGGNALPYRWRPMQFEHEGQKYINERAIATQQTGFWMVAQARNYLPDRVGGILWFGTDDAATSYLTPLYACLTAVPECFREGNGDMLHYSPTASFWLNNRISNACYKMYNVMAPTVREKIDAFEMDQIYKGTRTADSTALYLYNDIVYKIQRKMNGKSKTVMIDHDPFLPVAKYLTKYSVETAQKQFGEWKKLEELLLVKYIDGNVKPQNEDGSFQHAEFSEGLPARVEQPGYTDTWKKAVAEHNGDFLKVVETTEE